MSLSFLIFLLFFTTSLAADDAPCPFNITVLRAVSNGRTPTFDSNSRCQYILQALHLLQADYLRRTSRFVPPLNSSEACWTAFESFINEFARPSFNIRSSCGFQTSWISQGCMNITTLQQFQAIPPNSTLQAVRDNCNQSLTNNAPCALCTTKLSTLLSYFTGPTVGNVSECRPYTQIYAASFSDQYGPTDPGTAKCLFGLDFSNSGSGKSKTLVIALVTVFCVLGLLIVFGIWGYLRFKRRNDDRAKEGKAIEITQGGSGLDSMSQSTTLIRFTYNEIKKATRNFSRDNIIGMGGYGNVYKGVLSDGSQVALKRFKNCSVSGDASFTHEVEVIASVRHVNLVALRGYCTATTNMEGHQRIIVTDLMENGSLYDHLFGSAKKKLSWPIRQKIALGTAKGLSYLHYGAQPSIIHRDIKASNILLDEKFEAKVADFGLAKFNPEGMTHMSTRVAGTMGYVAPEYALYGQLTERTDVFSFGVVLLELLSGKKALQSNDEGQPTALTDLAWSLVRNGAALDVIEDGLPEPGSPQVLEKYVLVAVLCSHPQLYARPTMDQVVKMLETEDSVSVPSIMERPIPFIAGRLDIEKSASSNNSGQLCSPTGYQAYTMQSRHLSNSKEEEESSYITQSRRLSNSKEEEEDEEEISGSGTVSKD
ncbi:probable LRR receptor-like serine/threonine-protein kinase RKF3 [Lotus japonicus]|uniref:probable LRR receptor-like serine/threonine-protein kinase RKF3 n=1 Tax=Lotus japonicus TaxID=34305 RepID=UPI0025866655|nr:probable LRR receptor-like serine/threonine-protein kinase RKF3 [Lotus japonicus]